jgi:CheY-like chemotaxis protein
VDDTEPILHLLSRFLEDVADNIEFARDGTEAVEVITEADTADRPFDLVLMDLQMPHVSGLDAARKVRARGLDVPMIAMTAGGFDVRECAEAGFDGYVTKPFDRTRFLEFVADFLR